MIILAVLPTIVLITYVYRKDTIEKEPPGLLLRLFFLGALGIVPAMVVEVVLEEVLISGLPEDSLPYLLVDNFVVVALTEETVKFLVLRQSTWKSPHFNYLFDAIVYAVVVSLGFATVENILYLLEGSLVVAIARFVLSVPGHAIDAVFMGYFYGIAKSAERNQDEEGRKRGLRLALVVPVLIHGFYDFAISSSLLIPFFIFEILVTAAAITHVKRLSKEDSKM